MMFPDLKQPYGLYNDPTVTPIPWGVPGSADPRVMQASYSPQDQQPLFIPQNQQPQQQSYTQQPVAQSSPQQNLQPQDMQHVNDVMNQYIQSKQGQQNGGLLQQILSNRMQPSDQDTARSISDTASSFGSSNFSPMTPDAAMASRITNQLSPYSDALRLANSGADLSGKTMQNDVYAQTGLPQAQANLQLTQADVQTKLIANKIQQETGLPMAQAILKAQQITNQYLPQTLQSENALRGAQIPMMQAETAGKNITNQYLPQSLQADIAAKNAQAALAMGSNIFASPMGTNAGFGAAALLQPGGMTPVPSGTNPTPQQGQGQPNQGDQFLSQLTPQAAAQVKALAEGRMAFPSGFALKTPYWQNMLSAVSQYDPNFDAINYNARAAARKSFTSGPDANNIAALNTAMSHLSTLSDAYGTLGNSSVPALNMAKNYLGNNLGVSSIQTNTANVGVDAEAVAHELAKVFRSTGMSDGEINAWKDKINTNTSPAQSTALINSALDLMDGRLQALGAKYNQGMGTTADPIKLLSPEAQAAYTKLRGAAQPQQSAGGVTEGATATNPDTGEKIIFKNGQWGPQ